MTFAITGQARPSRIVKAAPRAWVCKCPGNARHPERDVHPAYLTRCTVCGTSRPKA